MKTTLSLKPEGTTTAIKYRMINKDTLIETNKFKEQIPQSHDTEGGLSQYDHCLRLSAECDTHRKA